MPQWFALRPCKRATLRGFQLFGNSEWLDNYPESPDSSPTVECPRVTGPRQPVRNTYKLHVSASGGRWLRSVGNDGNLSSVNEAETRAEHIDPALAAAGWGALEGSRILREYRITQGRLEGMGRRSSPDIADYVLVYRNQKLAVAEAKAWDKPLTEGPHHPAHDVHLVLAPGRLADVRAPVHGAALREAP